MVVQKKVAYFDEKTFCEFLHIHLFIMDDMPYWSRIFIHYFDFVILLIPSFLPVV